MGQYYRAVLGEDVYGLQVKGDVYNGLKLMEHSYWDNNFVNGVARKLFNKPTRVAWVGDYATDTSKLLDVRAVNNVEVVKIMPKFKEGFYPIIGERRADYVTRAKTFSPYMDKLKYLVNKDKKEYIDLQEYKERNSYTTNLYELFNPIPLLVAIGNGLGSGDYRGTNMEYVGAWAYDTILTTNRKPSKEYAKISVVFDLVDEGI